MAVNQTEPNSKNPQTISELSANKILDIKKNSTNLTKNVVLQIINIPSISSSTTASTIAAPTTFILSDGVCWTKFAFLNTAKAKIKESPPPINSILICNISLRHGLIFIVSDYIVLNESYGKVIGDPIDLKDIEVFNKTVDLTKINVKIDNPISYRGELNSEEHQANLK